MLFSPVIIGNRPSGGKHAGIVFGNAVLRHEAVAAFLGRLRNLRPNFLEPRVVDGHRHEVGFREIAIIFIALFPAQEISVAKVVIPAAGFLKQFAATVEDGCLTLDIGFQGAVY